MKKFTTQRVWSISENLINNIKSRNFVILPFYIGKTVIVHNGKTFAKIMLLNEMVGHKLGEFIATRKKFKFKKK